jgi:chromosome segregation ATPase
MAEIDDVKRLEAELQTIKDQLEAAKKRREASEARQRVRDSIQTQRAASQQSLDSAAEEVAKWQQRIEIGFPDEQKRQTLKTNIDNATALVADAEQKVTELKGKVDDDERLVRSTADKLTGLEKQLAERQTELSQLATKIKDAQKKVEALRNEVRGAIDAGNWTRAFYKNYRLQQEIEAAGRLLNPDQEEQRILNALDTLTADIVNAQDESKTAKRKLEEDKAAHKSAEQQHKEKKEGLETAIANFL